MNLPLPAGPVTLAAAALLTLGVAALFLVGLRQAWRGWRAARRLARLRRPLVLAVQSRADHGSYFQLVLVPAAWWRRWPWHPRPLPPFMPGAYLTLERPPGQSGPPGPRGPVTRRYSLAAWAAHPRAYELAIKREPEGQVSPWLHQHARPGKRLRARPPAGAFVLNPAALTGEVVLIAGGIGITPLRAMLHAWLQRGPAARQPLTLLWSVREMVELMDCHQEFTQLAARVTGLRYVPVLTGGDPAWRGERGRIDAGRVQAWLQTARPQGAWMCAGTAMMDDLRRGLCALGWEDHRIHHEAFGSTANTDTGSYQLTCTPSGRQLEFCGEPTLLAALSAAGEAIDSDCRNGSCGACRIRLLQGEVRQVLVPQWPLADGEQLACCCVPASNLLLALR